MTKPIAYYLSDPEDSDTIAEIAVTYGDRLQNLNPEEKISLIRAIAQEIWDRPDKTPQRLSADLLLHLETLSTDTLLGLLNATAEQLRHDK
ncbi:hypothetical protein ACQ4M3_08915 [Leptolyngbya sp. AN03gr2]|uniref:hypothetical protein n=1 Tax=unclassified Leptolyngbya TaxID=2650499 RepID=UPI003D315D94